MTAVFHMYDGDADGYLDVSDMQLLGWAVSCQQRLPTPAEAALQLQRADRDGDGRLSIDDFMRYATHLGRLPDHRFAFLRELLFASAAQAAATGLARQVRHPDAVPPTDAGAPGGATLGSTRTAVAAATGGAALPPATAAYLARTGSLASPPPFAPPPR